MLDVCALMVDAVPAGEVPEELRAVSEQIAERIRLMFIGKVAEAAFNPNCPEMSARRDIAPMIAAALLAERQRGEARVKAAQEGRGNVDNARTVIGAEDGTVSLYVFFEGGWTALCVDEDSLLTHRSEGGANDIKTVSTPADVIAWLWDAARRKRREALR